MLSVGAPIFVVIPDESKEPIFHSGKVLESDTEEFMAEFDHFQALPIGFIVSSYSEIDGKFYHQKATVKTIGRTEPNPVMSFKRIGPPESADRRNSYRVRMLRLALTARIGEEARCIITDISPEGFGAITIKALEIGSFVNVRFEYETQVVEGPVRVQCATKLSDGKHRCGFYVPERNGKMRRSLERIASMIQRLQLRTTAGFRALDANVEVNGETVFALVDGMGVFRQTALKILAKHGIMNLQRGKWYRQQAFLDAFSSISDKLGADVLFNIGTKFSENAEFPLGIDSLEKALISLDTAYHMNHRNGEIGHYYFTATGRGHYEMVCRNPYPCEFDRGILAAFCSRFTPTGSETKAIVAHDNSKPCRKDGADSCTYRIIWQ